MRIQFDKNQIATPLRLAVNTGNVIDIVCQVEPSMSMTLTRNILKFVVHVDVALTKKEATYAV